MRVLLDECLPRRLAWDLNGHLDPAFRTLDRIARLESGRELLRSGDATARLSGIMTSVTQNRQLESLAMRVLGRLLGSNVPVLVAKVVGRAAGTWERLGGFYTAPAILEEYIHCFLATDLTAIDHEPIPDEEITVVPWPLADLDALIAQVHDAKSLVGLLRLARRIGVS